MKKPNITKGSWRVSGWRDDSVHILADLNRGTDAPGRPDYFDRIGSFSFREVNPVYGGESSQHRENAVATAAIPDMFDALEAQLNPLVSEEDKFKLTKAALIKAGYTFP